MERPPTGSANGRASRRARRLRTIAVLVLVAGLAGAGAFYAIQVRTTPPPLDEVSAPGYLRARQHDVEVMMGPMGVTLLRWQDALEQPGAEAMIIAAAAALVALGIARAASRSEATEDQGSGGSGVA